MSYVTCSAALKSILLLLTATFSTGDVSEGDYRILDSGRTNLAILNPGSVPTSEIFAKQSRRRWEILLDLYIRFVDDTSYSSFSALRDVVLAQIEAYPTLNLKGRILVEYYQSDGDPSEVVDRQGAGPFFITQRFRVMVQETIGISAGEFI